MKVTWPKNVQFEKAELICQEEGTRGDKLVVEPDTDNTLLLTIFDGTRIANCVVSRRDILALGELIKTYEYRREDAEDE
jgi:hypothetical protein